MLLQYEKIIDSLIQNYQEHPDNYFAECDLQYKLYSLTPEEIEIVEGKTD